LGFDYWQVAVKFQKFPRFSVPYTLVGTLRLEAVRIILGVMASPVLVGDFSFAQRFTNFPVRLISGGVRPVVFQRAAGGRDHAGLEKAVITLVAGLLYLMAPLVVSGAAPFARILIFPALGLVLFSWLDRMFDVAGRQDLNLLLQTLFTLAGLGLLAVGLTLVSDPLWGIAFQAAVTVLHTLTVAVVVFRLSGFSLGRLGKVAMLLPLVLAPTLLSWAVLKGVLPGGLALGPGILLSWATGIGVWRKFLGLGAVPGDGEDPAGGHDS
jgi:hypothetical protein